LIDNDTTTLYQLVLLMLSGKLSSSLTSNSHECKQSNEELVKVEDYSNYGNYMAVETVGEYMKDLTMAIRTYTA